MEILKKKLLKLIQMTNLKKRENNNNINENFKLLNKNIIISYL